jgi:hypothetical protein
VECRSELPEAAEGFEDFGDLGDALVVEGEEVGEELGERRL